MLHGCWQGPDYGYCKWSTRRPKFLGSLYSRSLAFMPGNFICLGSVAHRLPDHASRERSARRQSAAVRVARVWARAQRIIPDIHQRERRTRTRTGRVTEQRAAELIEI